MVTIRDGGVAVGPIGIARPCRGVEWWLILFNERFRLLIGKVARGRLVTPIVKNCIFHDFSSLLYDCRYLSYALKFAPYRQSYARFTVGAASVSTDARCPDIKGWLAMNSIAVVCPVECGVPAPSVIRRVCPRMPFSRNSL